MQVSCLLTLIYSVLNLTISFSTRIIHLYFIFQCNLKARIRVYFERFHQHYTTSKYKYSVTMRERFIMCNKTIPIFFTMMKNDELTVLLCQSQKLIHIAVLRKSSATKCKNHTFYGVNVFPNRASCGVKDPYGSRTRLG